MGPLAKAWSISAIGRGFLGIEHRASQIGYSGPNGAKKKYQANHVHTGCDVAAVDEYEGGGPSPGTVKCLDDNFPTNGLGPASLAVQATRAATRYYDTIPDGEPLFNDGGYFKYNFADDMFEWAVDGGAGVEYAYDRDAYDDSYKLWKAGHGWNPDDNAGFYKVSLDCDYNSGDKPTCWLDFKCLQSWVDDEALFGDC